MIRVLLVAMGLLMLSWTAARADDAAEGLKSHVNTGTIVQYTTGINPDDYPCAKAGITKLYQHRGKIADLGSFHPRRIFTWLMDTGVYLTSRFVDFLKRLMNPDAVASGIRKVHAMATGGGNPLAAADRAVEGWARDLSPRNQYVLQKRVHGIIKNTTNEDGSCK